MLRTYLFLVCAASASAQLPTWLPRTANAPTTGSFAVAASQTDVFAYASQARQLWTWNGAQWNQIPTASPPPGALIPYACFDRTRNRLVMLFGDQSVGFSLWEWDGTAWRQQAQPPMRPRSSTRLVFDEVRNETLLFGGTLDGSNGTADTWAWNGSTWRQVGSGGPYPRWSTSMTFDSVRGTVVLFGGFASVFGQQVVLADTWEWNGLYWREHFGIAGPPARQGAGFAFDTRRGRAVLFGGANNQGGIIDTWEWNGTAWSQVLATPTAPTSAALVYDAARGTAVLVDPTATTQWEYVAGTATPAAFTTYGQGCAAPVTGVPVLAASPGSLPRVGSSFAMQLTQLPASPFNLPVGVIGFDDQTWLGQPLPLLLDSFGFTGCQAWLAPETFTALSNLGGTATWTIAVPLDLDLAGLSFFVQATVNAPTANPGAFVFSNAGHGVVGTP